MRQVSVERLFDDNRERTGLTWLAGRQGGSRALTGDSALQPTIGHVGHMNFIHPFRIQILGAAELAYLRGLPQDELDRVDRTAVHHGARGDRRRQRRGRVPSICSRSATRITSRCSRRRSRRRTSST